MSPSQPRRPNLNPALKGRFALRKKSAAASPAGALVAARTGGTEIVVQGPTKATVRKEGGIAPTPPSRSPQTQRTPYQRVGLPGSPASARSEPCLATSAPAGEAAALFFRSANRPGAYTILAATTRDMVIVVSSGLLFSAPKSLSSAHIVPPASPSPMKNRIVQNILSHFRCMK